MADLSPDIITPDVEARFWAKVDRRGPDDCWLYSTRSKYANRAVFFEIRGVKFSPAHFALVSSGLERQRNLWALHSCDNPACVNPAHLRWGTPKENAEDRGKRGRSVFVNGTAKRLAKLTDEKVLLIRNDGRSCGKIAAIYGVSKSLVYQVKTGKIWKHVA